MYLGWHLQRPSYEHKDQLGRTEERDVLYVCKWSPGVTHLGRDII